VLNRLSVIQLIRASYAHDKRGGDDYCFIQRRHHWKHHSLLQCLLFSLLAALLNVYTCINDDDDLSILSLILHSCSC
jgi:hypothetical protein